MAASRLKRRVTGVDYGMNGELVASKGCNGADRISAFNFVGDIAAFAGADDRLVGLIGIRLILRIQNDGVIPRQVWAAHVETARKLRMPKSKGLDIKTTTFKKHLRDPFKVLCVILAFV